MSHFTVAQASSSKLESARKEFIDGTFGYWVLRVSGSDGQMHQFVDHELTGSATSTQVKAKLISYMTGSEYFIEPVPPVISGSAEHGSSIGSTLG